MKKTSKKQAGVAVHGIRAAHSNGSGRYRKFCCEKIAPNLNHVPTECAAKAHT